MQPKVPLWLINFLIFVYHSTPILFAVSSPALEAEIGADINLGQLMSSFYFSGFTCGLMLFGRISDLWGRRKTMLIGITIFVIASVLLVIGNNPYLLLAFKFIQAFGVSVCSIVTQATSRDSYQGADLMRIYGLNGILVCFVPTVETSIGGFILEKLSWRYCMAWDALKGFLVLICCACWLPETIPDQVRREAGKIKFFSVFKRFMQDKTVIMYGLTAGLSIGMLTGFIIEMPFVFLKSFEIKPTTYGALNVIITVVFLGANFLNLYLIQRQDFIKDFIYYSLWFSFAGCMILLTSSYFIQYTSPVGFMIMVAFMLARLLQGFAHNLLMPYVLGIALEKYRGLFGSASAIFNSMYYFVISMLTFAISYVHQDYSIHAYAVLVSMTSFCTILLFKQTR
ncbi:hypothetical protein phytr_6580 [Candidatus Phycorickettsia trachydisci]|uniref:Major facilitator superfamily (MFS) profile domain-containing protein n=1 Tax=Candidatus Phycorickettsia trachydisci TaxID=2115978 RepID=A0A2P1P8J9_9RICK|nr:MFS transporter [Candidatus Phycorickettsia trachydisci]AVP87599.1 hypothetical protein phytr_6580 [Candidatus Phycorickettsia trachydisci]